MSECTVERLQDPELEMATGGNRAAVGSSLDKVEYVYDSRGRNCGKFINDVLHYWPCKKCWRPTHMGSGFHQCDKCDDWFWSISNTRYYGTKEDLIRESDAN